MLNRDTWKFQNKYFENSDGNLLYLLLTYSVYLKMMLKFLKILEICKLFGLFGKTPPPIVRNFLFRSLYSKLGEQNT